MSKNGIAQPFPFKACFLTASKESWSFFFFLGGGSKSVQRHDPFLDSKEALGLGLGSGDLRGARLEPQTSVLIVPPPTK